MRPRPGNGGREEETEGKKEWENLLME